MASENTEIKTYFGRCRCCLNYGYLKNMWEEHEWQGDKEIYVEMLLQCFALSWEQSEDSMENDQICEACIIKLRDANQFKKTILESQEQLLNQIEEDCELPVKIENVDFSIKNDSDDEATATTSMYIDDPDDPHYVDPDDLNDMEYEEVEYLEEEDNKEVCTSQQTPQMERRTRTPAQTQPERKWPRKLPKAERYKTYKQYTEEDLRKCIEAVRNEEMTAQEASEKYNIPKKTIIARVKMDPKDDQKGNTTENKTKLRNKTTILHTDKLKSKLIKKVKIMELNKKDEDILSVLDTPVDAEQVRTKYKAIINTKFKKEGKEPDKSNVNEMNKHKENLRHILECSNATMIKGFWGNGYSCCFCDIQKETPSELKTHNLELHNNVANDAIKVKYVSDLVIRLDITDLKCKLCNINLDSLEIFTEHLVKIHNKFLHKDIKNHVIPFKFETDRLQCIKCKKQFKYFKLLSEHMSEHYRNYECPMCERAFINKQSMQTHSYRHRSGIFKCLHCPKIFDTKPKRNDHVKMTHTLSNKTRKRNYRDKKFSTKDTVQNHEAKIHGTKISVFNCQACSKSYTSQCSLIIHQKRFHLMHRPHKCSFCDMAFFSRIELQSHTVTHTKTREFKCEKCNKCFGTKCGLNQHVRGHLDDRRFKCDCCDRAFVHRTAFRVHMRSKHAKIV